MSTLEETAKIVSKKDMSNGETTFEKMDQDMAQRLNGTTITDADGNRVKVKDTGRTVTEAEENTITLDEGDTLNLGKDLKEVVVNTLRNHGDSVDYTRVTVNRNQKYITVYVNYEKDPDNPGRSTEDAFKFIFGEGQVKLDSDGQVYDICPLTQQSGTVAIQKDIAEDNLMNFLKDKTNIAENEKEDDGNDDLLLGFKQVVEEYRANKNKETVKNLLRKARDFEGNTIQEKLQNAIKQYKECFLGEEDGDGDVVAVDAYETAQKIEDFLRVAETYGRNSETVKNLAAKLQPLMKELYELYQELGEPESLDEVSSDTYARAAQKAYDKGRRWQSEDFAKAAKHRATSNEDLKQDIKAYGVGNITVIDRGTLGNLWYSIDDDGQVVIQDKDKAQQWEERVPIPDDKRFDGPMAKQLARLVAKWYDRYGTINKEEGSDWHNWVIL